jgi:hypothetical protein
VEITNQEEIDEENLINLKKKIEKEKDEVQ